MRVSGFVVLAVTFVLAGGAAAICTPSARAVVSPEMPTWLPPAARTIETSVAPPETASADLPAFHLRHDAASAVPSNAVQFQGHYYLLVDDRPATWAQAQANCEQRGGYLASITSKEENDFLYSYMRSLGVKDAYFGATDVAHEGEWKWIHGEPWQFTNWARGEPNNESGREHYGMFYWKFTNGQWNDGTFVSGTVGAGRAYFCEWGGTFTPAGRHEVVASLDRLRDALLWQADRYLDLTASTFIYTSDYRENAKMSETFARWLRRLSDFGSWLDRILIGQAIDPTEVAKGQLLNDLEKTQRYLDALPKTGTQRVADVAALRLAIANLIGDLRSVDAYETSPEGFTDLSKRADSVRKQYARQGLDAAIAKFLPEVEYGGNARPVPLRAAQWGSGGRPSATGWAPNPLQLKAAVRTLFSDLEAALPQQLPAGADTAALVANLEALRTQVVATGNRRIVLSTIPALQGPGGIERWVSLGVVDAHWGRASTLGSAYVKKQKVRQKQVIVHTLDTALTVIDYASAGTVGKLGNVVSSVELSYDIGREIVTLPETSSRPVDAMNENEAGMLLGLVQDLAGLYEVANCASYYARSTLGMPQLQ